MASIEAGQWERFYKRKGLRTYKTTDATPRVEELPTTIEYYDDDIPMLMRVSAIVMAVNPTGYDNSYVWQVEGVYELNKYSGIYDEQVTPSITAIAEPATPVCTLNISTSSRNVRFTMTGEAGETFNWHIDATFEMVQTFKAGLGYPPRITLQISSGMDPGENYTGLTEGIHDMLPSTYERKAYTSYNSEEWTRSLDSDFILLSAGGSATGWRWSMYSFFWDERSFSASTYLYVSSGTGPLSTVINGLLRDELLDKVLVVGSGPTEVTFTWSRCSGDPTDAWGNY